METQETICRLCLKTCESFKVIEGNMKAALDKLLPKIDLAAIQEPVMCTNCADMLIKCFDFKTACLYAYDYIISFVNNKGCIKLDLKDVYLCKNENSTGVPEDQDVCGFCIGSVKKYSAVSLIAGRQDIMLKKMVEQCIPELDLGIIKNSVICASCYGCLEKCFHFVTNCLIVEEKIKKYRESLDLNGNCQIKLSNLLQSAIRNATSEDDNSVDKIKVEEQFCKEEENADEQELCNGRIIFKLEQIFCDENENAKNGVENKSSVSMDDLKFNNGEQCIPKNMFVCKEDYGNLDVGVIKMEETLCEENKIKVENLEMGDETFLADKEIEIKTDDFDFNRLDDNMVSAETTMLHRKQKCLNLNLGGDLSTPALAHRKSSRIIYQCECCSFQTKYKRYIKSHLMTHKDPSKVTMFKCNSCPFKTKHEGHFKRHLLRHNDPSERTMFKCDSCSFQTKRNADLKRHLLVHKDSSEIAIYTCDFCSYCTIRKYNLKSHLLAVHKISSELKIYKCDFCSYETKHTNSLKSHLLTHKDPSEITVYKCYSCSYWTEQKHDLKTHQLVHKNPEVCQNDSFVSEKT